MHNEEWKQVAGYPNYWVSSLGRVRKGDKIKRLSVARNGYLLTGMTNDKGERTTALVHRLVCETFMPTDYMYDVNHKDGVKSNNALCNLEWATRQENIQHSVRMGLHFANKALSDREVRAAQALRDFGMQVKDIAVLFEVCDNTIYRSTKNAKSRFSLAA